jgi:hypothetical protein
MLEALTTSILLRALIVHTFPGVVGLKPCKKTAGML